MKISSKALSFQLVVFLFWNAICLSAYWDELPKALLFGLGFGIPLCAGELKGNSRVSRKADALITGSFGIVFVFLILAFQIFEIPLLTAGLVAGFIIFLIAARWFANGDDQTTNTAAE